MKIHTVIFVLVLVFMSFFSCIREGLMRNKIHFNDDIKKVQKSISEITILLKKIQDPILINKGYDFKGDSLFINNISISDNNLDTIHALSKLNNIEKRELLKLADYLRKNEITSGTYDNYLSLWLFEYRYRSDGSSNDSRVISILNKNDINRNNLKMEILDQKEMLYLLKFK